MIINRELKKEELLQVKKLLENNNLPHDDLERSKVKFIISKNKSEIIGSIGIELYGTDVLLRSFLVKQNYKNKGLGSILLMAAIEKCKSEKVTKIHLLTTTAETYFAKKGFDITERIDAPNSILHTKEFSEICPSSSIYMTLKLD